MAKYQLNSDNRVATNEAVIYDMRRVAALSPGSRLTAEAYEKLGRFSRQMVHRRFGSWNTALANARLEISKQTDISAQDAIEDVKRVAKSLGVATLTRAQYDANGGRFSSTTVGRRCGGWFTALSEAGLAPSRTLGVTDEQWFENSARVWDHLGRQPSYSDMSQPPSAYSPEGYAKRFGGWRKALEKFIAFVNKDEPRKTTESCAVPTTYRTPVGRADKPVRRGPRQPGWRLKFLVLRRDGAQCRLCHQSRARDPDLKLVLDHIIPWEKGGKTEFENLQVLCERCNGGKSNLDWTV